MAALDTPDGKNAAEARPRANAAAMSPAAVDPSMPGTEILPVVVFACVFTTILIFAVGFPMTKSKLTATDTPPPPHDVDVDAHAALPDTPETRATAPSEAEEPAAEESTSSQTPATPQVAAAPAPTPPPLPPMASAPPTTPPVVSSTRDPDGP